jgi:FHIPEP family/Putative bacterial sensory transduction regulator
VGPATKAAPLGICVGLGPDLAGYVDAGSREGAELRDALHDHVRELLEDLRIPAEPSVRIEPLPEPGHHGASHGVRVNDGGWSLAAPMTAPVEIAPERLAAEVAETIADNRELCVTADVADRLQEEWAAGDGLARAAASLGPADFRALLTSLVRRCCSVSPLAVGASEAHGDASTGVPAMAPDEAVEAVVADRQFAPIPVSVGPKVARSLGHEPRPPARPYSSEVPLADLGPLLAELVFDQLGLAIPAVTSIVDPTLPEGSFRFQINDLRFPPLPGLRADEAMVNADPSTLASLGVGGRPGLHPTHGGAATIVRVDDQDLSKLGSEGHATWGPEGYVSLALAREVRRHAGALLLPQAVVLHMSHLRTLQPATVEPALTRFGQHFITAVLRRLLDEHVSIRDLAGILEGMLAVDGGMVANRRGNRLVTPNRATLWQAREGVDLSAPGVGEYADCVRRHLRLQLTRQHAGLAVELPTITVDERLEARLRESPSGPLDDTQRNEIGRRLRTAWPSLSRFTTSPAVLTSSDVRQALRAVVARQAPLMPVLSRDEVAPYTRTTTVGRINSPEGPGEEDEVAAPIEETRDRVASMLAQIVGPVQVDQDGDLTFPFESTRVYVSVRPFGEASSVVSVFAITNVGLTPSDALAKFVATHGSDWLFGHLAMAEHEGMARLIFNHTLLGDYLDREELEVAVAAVATTADRLDDEIKEQFGGQTMSELSQGDSSERRPTSGWGMLPGEQ